MIAAYAHQLANSPEMYNTNSTQDSRSGVGGKSQTDLHSRQLVRELERKNREIMRDIHQLKHAHRNRSQRLMQHNSGQASQDPTIVTELEVSGLSLHLKGQKKGLIRLLTAKLTATVCAS